ncbi:hypothetical protein ACFX2I_014937 [Malus domestica]
MGIRVLILKWGLNQGDWRLRFSCQLTSFAKDRIAKLGGADWVGGAGNHKDAFLPLYANLLAFYAFSNCIFNGKTGDNKHLQSDVAKLVAARDWLTITTMLNQLTSGVCFAIHAEGSWLFFMSQNSSTFSLLFCMSRNSFSHKVNLWQVV